MEADMKIGIIGAGKVGTTLAKYVKDHGACVTGFYNRTESSGRESAEFTGTEYFTTLDSLMKVSDTLFITTTDKEIEKVWDCIAKKNVKGKVICHFSGSLSSDIFSNWEETGAYVCSVHPIYAFSNKFTAYQNLTGAAFAVEGHRTALTRMQELFRLLPNRIVEISTSEKVKYHAATSIASNHVVGLISMAVELMQEAEIPEASAYELLKPLVENNVKSIFEKETQEGNASGTEQTAEYRGCAQALTGPIERNDTETVRKHLKHLDRRQWELAYRAVGTAVTELAEKKHPERSYETMKKILGHE
ncbi:DUF2520 domain-containing protein [Petralouisia muris]|jgi:predicted short-subunit dehydrogenase-like oxidoreductase (DUF2520 family)|uniref:DUF2520 domain-containing protein n=1 Tax=Petralouisia muris TaxID=3032872 RepID=A0AC61S101_9FIRM|nr:DUF2520 domain-containing protein [Petralouisia muris]